jgi:hypothetical protein
LVAPPKPLALRPSLSLREMLLGKAMRGSTVLAQAIHALTIWFAARVPQVRRHDAAARQFDEADLVWRVAALARTAIALAPD